MTNIDVANSKKAKEKEEKYEHLLQQASSGERPVVLVNACTHGHETVGVCVIENMQKETFRRGTILYTIANERAKEKSVAFIESDLNRVFPGNSNGDYEERLAAKLHPIVEACDIVFDIHSTNTTDPGEESMLIVTKLDEETKNIIEMIAPPRVLVMECARGNALISDAKIGIAFEYGRNDHPETARRITRDIFRALSKLGMIENKDVSLDEMSVSKTRAYRVFATLPKTEGFILEKTIRNFHPLQKGEIVARRGGETLRAERGFIPILFGENRYKDIFGFMAEEISTEK